MTAALLSTISRQIADCERCGDFMSIVTNILAQVKLPEMLGVHQSFDHGKIKDLETELRQMLAGGQMVKAIQPKMRVAITAGSRGICNISAILRILVEEVFKREAYPFIIPAMGSHGGATAEGQCKVLMDLGITEKSMGCPICSSMKVVQIGKTQAGKPVFLDSYAAEADGIIVVNRIKAHTSFTGSYESGLLKMMAVGLGKQAGAQVCHSEGHGRMAEFVEEYGKAILKQAKILFGVAVIENAYNETRRIELVEKEEIIMREPRLLQEAKLHMPHLYLSDIDVLIVDKMGKDISGLGMDPHVTGCFATRYVSGPKRPGSMAVLDMTEAAHGNANGVGVADVITRRLLKKIDFASTYANAMTATLSQAAKIPMIMENDQEAVRAAIVVSGCAGRSDVRIVHIQDTLHLEKISISQALLKEVSVHPQMRLTGEKKSFVFDSSGNLLH